MGAALCERALSSEPTSVDVIVLKHHIDMSKDVCLFVTHASDCNTKPHVAHHVRALANAGFQVILVYNTDRMAIARRAMSFAAPNGIIVRKNEGFDFGAWADVLRLYPDLWECSRLLLVNDSVIGPVRGGATMFARLRAIDADLVGLVKSYEFTRHFQSFFLMLNRRALENGKVREFWRSVVNYENKSRVIKAYELRFTELCAQSGLSTQAIYQRSIVVEQFNRGNPTINHWHELIRLGFPYIKVELVRDWLTDKGLDELKRLIADPELMPFIDSHASMRQTKKG
jgi:hypothetical protein